MKQITCYNVDLPTNRATATVGTVILGNSKLLAFLKSL